MNHAVPKKVKAALQRLGIRNVVSGYVTAINRYLPLRGVAVFTGWNTRGEVVCLLEKENGEDWKIHNRA